MPSIKRSAEREPKARRITSEPTADKRVDKQGAEVPVGLAGPSDAQHLQATFGNQAVRRLVLSQIASRNVIQRRLNAVPQNFTVTNGAVNHAETKINTPATWTSSTNDLADLNDVQMREVVDFGEDPQVKVPGYAGLLAMNPAFTLAGNILTKRAGHMAAGSANDEHTGAAWGPKFTMNGIANLQKSAWVLTGTQQYEYCAPENPGVWVPLHGGNFTITRTMALVGDHYELTTQKVGPNGVNVTAGPTRIDFETRGAMSNLLNRRANQDASWNADRTSLTDAGLLFHQLAQEQRQLGGGAQLDVVYEEARPGGPIAGHMRGPGGSQFTSPAQLGADVVAMLLQTAQAAVTRLVQKALGPGTSAAPPQRVRFLFFPEGVAGVRQQSYFTSENGGTYRVILKGASINTPGTGLQGTMAGMREQSIPGLESKQGWFTQYNKLWYFCKATAAHELGHMMHAHNAPEIYLSSTIMPGVGNPVPINDPYYLESLHVASVNQQIMARLGAVHLPPTWSYALANPAEVVAEGFTAMTGDRDVPQAIAAVYVAYGGMRSNEINAKLTRAFGGPVPALGQPEAALPHI